MNPENTNAKSEEKPFISGSVNNLVDSLQILDATPDGECNRLSVGQGRTVQVAFLRQTKDGEVTEVGTLEKWHPRENNIWVLVRNPENPGGFDHHRLFPDQEIKWRLLKFEDEK